MGGKSKKTTIGYRYFMGLHMGLCRGPIDALRQIRVGDKVAWTGTVKGNQTVRIDQPDLFGGEEQEGGIQGDLAVLLGKRDQLRHEGLASMLGGLVSAFRGVTTTFFDGLVCAMSPYPKEWSYLVQKTKQGWQNDAVWYPETCELLMSVTAVGNDKIGPTSGGWRYKQVALSDASNYSATGFDDSSWSVGQMPFASRAGHPYAEGSGFPTIMNTEWPLNTAMWLRKSFDVTDASEVPMTIFIDNFAKVWVNGSLVLNTTDTTQSAAQFTIPASVLRPGANVIAIYAADDEQTGGGDYTYAATRVDPEDGDLLIYGMNPAHILRRLYTDSSIGRGLSADRLDEESWRSAAETFYNEGMALCLKWSRSGSVAEFAGEVINHAGAAIYTSRRTGKIVLTPIRADYDEADLPLFTPDTGLLGIDDDDSTAQSSGVNEVVVTWSDPQAKAEKSVREKNLGAIMAAGGVTVSESVSYLGIPTEGLARRVARRDLQAKSGFIKRFTVRLDRRGKDIMPGHVFRISDPGRGIENMVLRAGRVEFGTITDGTMTVIALQDVFGLPATVYRAPEVNGYVPPDGTPQPALLQAAMEAPYRELAQALSASDLAALDASTGYLHGMAAKPSGMSVSFVLQTRVSPADYKTVADMSVFCPGGLLAADIGKLETQLTLTGGIDLANIEAGQAALLGTEIVRIDAVDTATATVTVARGCIDTVPADHPAGEALLCYDTFGGDDQTEYMDGVTVDALILPRTGSGTLNAALAMPLPTQFVGRAARPYPPANVLINDASYPDVASGAITVKWAHRDRITQADKLVDFSQASIGPEAGVKYTLHAYAEHGSSPVHTEADIDGTISTAWTPSSEGKYRLELFSTRDGLECLQRYSHLVQIGEGSGDPYMDLIMASAPAAYWRLDDSSGLVAVDASGNHRDATYTSDVSAWSAEGLLTDAAYNKCISLSGAVQSLQDGLWISPPPVNTSAAWTFCCLLKPRNAPAYDNGVIMQMNSQPSGVTTPELGMVAGSSGKFRLRVMQSGIALLILSADEYSYGTRLHVTVRYVPGKVELIVNGVVTNTATHTYGSSTGRSQFGFAKFFNPATFYPFPGELDEIAVFSKALTDAEILALYAAS